MNNEVDIEILNDKNNEASIIVSLNELNSLNIIINDDNCRDNYVNEICDILQKDGIKFKLVNGSTNLKEDNSIIITLDQQYVAGYAAIVFAPLINNGKDNSDALVLSASAAFKKNGIFIDGISCGQIGFRENEKGEIVERGQSMTEQHLSDFQNNSFVTIALGTQDINPSVVATSIEETLARYYSYIKSNRSKEDLIYCVEKDQDYNAIAKILNTSSDILDSFNKTADDNILLTGETIINPIITNIIEFDEQSSVHIDK